VSTDAAHVAAPTAATLVGAVIGSPVRQSLSPAIHNAAFRAAALDWVFVALEVAPGRAADAVAAMRVLGLRGLAVTMPHKEAVSSAVDEVDEAAAALRSVNTVVLRDDGSTFGASTDGAGFVASLEGGGHAVAGCTFAVLGAGGAARAVAAGLADAGAVVEVIARRPDAVDFAPAFGWEPEVLTGHFGDADLVVDCTSLALHETAEAPLAALPVAALRSEAMVASLVYHRRGPLLDAAARRNLRILDGRGMLVHQGARAFTLWTGRPAPVAVMAAALEAAIKTV
jgi:shikimate dehydrogenase